VKIFAVAPHPDDIEFAIGGVLLLAKQRGHDITLYCNTKLDEYSYLNEQDKRFAEMIESSNKLGSHRFFCVDGDIKKIVNDICDEAPDIIFVPDNNDFNSIHRKTTDIIINALSLAMLRSCEVSQLFYYEAFSNENFIPDIIIDVSSCFSQAKRLLEIHKEGIKILPSITYKFMLQHQIRGFQGSCFYGEGLRLDNSKWFQWCKNKNKGIEFLHSLVNYARTGENDGIISGDEECYKNI